MEITNFYSPNFTYSLKFVKFKQQDDEVDMQIDSQYKDLTDDTMKPGIYNWAKQNKNYIDLLDSTSISQIDNSAIYNILRENI